MYSGISSNVDVSFASDVEITLKREVSLNLFEFNGKSVLFFMK